MSRSAIHLAETAPLDGAPAPDLPGKWPARWHRCTSRAGAAAAAWPCDVLYAIHQCGKAPPAARAGSYHRHAQISFQRSQIYVDFSSFPPHPIGFTQTTTLGVIPYGLQHQIYIAFQAGSIANDDHGIRPAKA